MYDVPSIKKKFKLCFESRMVLFWNMAQVDQYLESKKSKELSKKI